MGHRALVAYRHADGTFTLRYAQWGDGLAAAIGPETPLGGPADRPDATDFADRLGVADRDGFDPPNATRVALDPLAAGVSADEVLAALDASYEFLVVVSPSYDATAYLVCSLDPGTAGTDLVLARPDGDPDSLRSWFVETKSRLSAAVADGDLDRDAARATLRRGVAARARVYQGDDASFLRAG